MRAEDRIPDAVLACLPRRWRAAFEAMPAAAQRELCEIRLRVGRPVAAVFQGRRHEWLGPFGLISQIEDAPAFTRDDADQFLQAISDSSVYALEEQLRQGYVTLPGGHRVGLCGETVIASGVPRSINHIGSFMIRLARSVPGCAERVLPHVVDARGRARSTLIVAPPGCGKTTLLRDLVRLLSTGSRRSERPGLNVGVVDERSEIAAFYKGIAQHDLGPRVDVVDNCPKPFGIMQLLRAMGPDVIVTDEIGSPDDANALQEALHAGVSVLASAHGASWEDVRGRPGLRALVEPVAFERVVLLSDRRGPGTVERIIDTVSTSRRGHKSSTSSIHMR